MTEEDQDAAVGRLVTRYSAAKKRRAALLSEAAEAGETLKKAGDVLRGLHWYAEMHDGRDDGQQLHRNKSDAAKAVPDYVEVARSRDLIAELRTVSAELRELRKLIVDAGLNVD